jgi:hypothetical protein
MKKQYLLGLTLMLVLFVFELSSPIHAQPTFLTNIGTLPERKIVDSVVTYTYTNGAKSLSRVFEYSWNQNDQVQSLLWFTDPQRDSSFRYTVSYDVDGVLTRYQIDPFVDGEFVPGFRYSLQYDSVGRFIQNLLYAKQANDTVWSLFGKDSTTYNSQGLRDSYINYRGISSPQGDRYVFNYKYDYEYDGFDEPSRWLQSDYDDNLAQWEPTTSRIFTRNSQGVQISVLDSQFTNGIWIPKYQNYRHFDNQQKVEYYVTRNWDAMLNTWVNTDSFSIQYQTTGFTEVVYTWANGQWEINRENIFYTSGAPSGLEAGMDVVRVLVFPNPTSKAIRLSVDQSIPLRSVRISDMQGRHIKSLSSVVPDAPIDVSSLQPGRYMIQGRGQQGNFSGIFIKQ